MRVDNRNAPKHPKLKELFVLLNTFRGSVPLNRDVGIDPRLIDKPITIIEKIIQQELHRQITKYIKGLTLNKITCKFENQELLIVCEVELNGRI